MSELSVNDFYALRGKIYQRIIHDEWTQDAVNGRASVVRVGDQYIEPATYILKHRWGDYMSWDPTKPEFIEDLVCAKVGWVPVSGIITYNQFRPAPVYPGDPSQAAPWVAHQHRLYGGEAERVMDYRAHVAQHPGVKINHAILFTGDPGIGKDTLIEFLVRTIGVENHRTIDPGRVFDGDQNEYIASILLRVNELRGLGNRMEQFYELSKTFLAAPPEFIELRGKWRRSDVYCVNVCATMMTSNHHTALFLPANDRRYHVVASNQKQDDMTPYCEELWRMLQGDGWKHVAAFLRERDISNFDPKAPPPKTEAFWQITSKNVHVNGTDADFLGELDVFTLEMLPTHWDTMEMDTEDGNGEHRLYDEHREFYRNPKNRPHFAKRLEEAGYTAIMNPGDKTKGLWTINHKKQRIYGSKDLSDAERLEEAQRLVRAAARGAARDRDERLAKQAAEQERKEKTESERAERERWENER
jgi:DNA polymerase III delta prime subunit